jgi:hypothetical protein
MVKVKSHAFLAFFALFAFFHFEPSIFGQSAVANYPLDGSAVDVSGNGFNGTINGATSSTNRFGTTQSALNFNGTSDFINSGNPAAFNFPSNFTISAWVKLNGSQLAKYVVAKYNGAGLPRSYGLATDALSARAYAFVSSPTGTAVEALGGASLNDSKWHSLNFVYDNAVGIRLYVDGGVVASKAAVGYGPFTNNMPLTIGGLTTAQFFGGQIDDVRIYDRALTTAEIDTLYRADISADLTVAAAIKLQVPTVAGHTYQFESSVDLTTWTPLGNPFTATNTVSVRYVDAIETEQFFRLTVP